MDGLVSDVPQLSTRVDVDTWQDSTPLLGSRTRLRQRAIDAGFIYFRQLIEREAVERLRADTIRVCHTHGLVEEANGHVHAVSGSALVERSSKWWAFYADALRMRSLYAVPWSAALMDVMESILNDEVFPHPCSILRAISPGDAIPPKPAHQDVRYVGGRDSTWTVWIPFDDCPRECGGVSVLPGSHRFGVLPVRPAGSGHEAVWPEGLRWVGGDTAAGDVIVFSTMTVHRGLPNITRDRLRLSVDYRFQSRRAPVRLDALLPYLKFLTWADIYRDWQPGDPLSYYWRRMDLTYAAD